MFPWNTINKAKCVSQLCELFHVSDSRNSRSSALTWCTEASGRTSLNVTIKVLLFQRGLKLVWMEEQTCRMIFDHGTQGVSVCWQGKRRGRGSSQRDRRRQEAAGEQSEGDPRWPSIHTGHRTTTFLYSYLEYLWLFSVRIGDVTLSHVRIEDDTGQRPKYRPWGSNSFLLSLLCMKPNVLCWLLL